MLKVIARPPGAPVRQPEFLCVSSAEKTAAGLSDVSEETGMKSLPIGMNENDNTTTLTSWTRNLVSDEWISISVYLALSGGVPAATVPATATPENDTMASPSFGTSTFKYYCPPAGCAMAKYWDVYGSAITKNCIQQFCLNKISLHTSINLPDIS